MSTLAIYGKTVKKSFLFRTKKALGLNLGIMHRWFKLYQVCLNDDCWLTFDLFKARSNLRLYIDLYEGEVQKFFFSIFI